MSLYLLKGSEAIRRRDFYRTLVVKRAIVRTSKLSSNEFLQRGFNRPVAYVLSSVPLASQFLPLIEESPNDIVVELPTKQVPADLRSVAEVIDCTPAGKGTKKIRRWISKYAIELGLELELGQIEDMIASFAGSNAEIASALEVMSVLGSYRSDVRERSSEHALFGAMDSVARFKWAEAICHLVELERSGESFTRFAVSMIRRIDSTVKVKICQRYGLEYKSIAKALRLHPYYVSRLVDEASVTPLTYLVNLGIELCLHAAMPCDLGYDWMVGRLAQELSGADVQAGVSA